MLVHWRFIFVVVAWCIKKSITSAGLPPPHLSNGDLSSFIEDVDSDSQADACCGDGRAHLMGGSLCCLCSAYCIVASLISDSVPVKRHTRRRASLLRYLA
ncbi:hypothetical protein OH492_16155 [Vibrio chagasii]|nr:hypothetical protein [Vibrio chagasii]